MAISQGFTPDQVLRYARHLILPEVGGQGQRKLLKSRVLLLGAGGLGSPVGLYLAAAGVGTLGLVDFDVVDASNLQRQILHGVADVGRRKVESAADRLSQMNPDVNVIGHDVHFNSSNAMEIISGYDIVVDGTDNFPTRYLANDVCYFAGKPLVHGSIYRFEGMVSVFMPGRGCYRCLFESPPPPGAVPSCAEAGVFGVLPGIIGTVMAFETIKLILGLGELLTNRMLIFEGMDTSFREVKLNRRAECPLCGDDPSIHELIDYEAFCGVPARESSEVSAGAPA